MDCISANQLWLGHAGDGCDALAIYEKGIEAVMQLAAEEPAAVLPREIASFRIPLLDGGGNDYRRLRTAVWLLSELLLAEVPTLVCCSAGASRSPAIAAFSLARLRNQSPKEALKFIREQRPTDVSPGLWNELLTCFGESEQRHGTAP